MGEPTVVTATAKFDSRRHGSTQHVDTPYLGWVDRTTPVHSSCGLVSSLKCNNERHRAPHSFGGRTAREKLLAVPRPIAGMRSSEGGMVLMYWPAGRATQWADSRLRFRARAATVAV